MGKIKNNKDTEAPLINESTSGFHKDSKLEEFFVDELKDIYWAEKHLIKSLPKMSKAATTPELKSLFEDHLLVTQNQVTELEKVFQLMGRKAQAKKCEAMAGLTKEAETIIEDTEKGSMTRDVGLILAAQKVEHYEIATYGTLARVAKTMGRTDVAEILGTIMKEEKDADHSLTVVAENSINVEAELEPA